MEIEREKRELSEKPISFKKIQVNNSFSLSSTLSILKNPQFSHFLNSHSRFSQRFRGSEKPIPTNKYILKTLSMLNKTAHGQIITRDKIIHPPQHLHHISRGSSAKLFLNTFIYLYFHLFIFSARQTKQNDKIINYVIGGHILFSLWKLLLDIFFMLSFVNSKKRNVAFGRCQKCFSK